MRMHVVCMRGVCMCGVSMRGVRMHVHVMRGVCMRVRVHACRVHAWRVQAWHVHACPCICASSKPPLYTSVLLTRPSPPLHGPTPDPATRASAAVLSPKQIQLVVPLRTARSSIACCVVDAYARYCTANTFKENYDQQDFWTQPFTPRIRIRPRIHSFYETYPGHSHLANQNQLPVVGGSWRRRAK